MNEIWRDIDGFSLYQVSSEGKIRNKKTGKQIKEQISTDGYLRVSLRDDNGVAATRMIHKLVAEAFIDNPDPKKYTIVNHIDQNRRNACANNLEWVTAKENANHSNRNELIALSRETPVNEYDKNGKYLRTWKSASRAANYYEVYKDAVTHAMAFKTYVKGRYFAKWNGPIRDIDLSNRICKSEQADYSAYGPINPEDLFEAKSIDERFEEIKKREMGAESVTVPIMKADMEFLKQYVRRLERSLEKKAQPNAPADVNVVPNINEKTASEASVYAKADDDIIIFLKKGNIKYIDNRGKGGALWIVGGKELANIVNKAKEFGITFRFKPKGGKATNKQPGWWAD